MIKRIIGAAILLRTENMAQAGVFISTSYG